MNNDNKRNLLYFEADSMRELYETMEQWQEANSKRLLSTSIQLDMRKFCCIALSNPMEVVICDDTGLYHASVSPDKSGGRGLRVMITT